MNAREESLQAKMLREQKRTNELLLLLIDALAESDEDLDAMPTVHLDGTPITR